MLTAREAYPSCLKPGGGFPDEVDLLSGREGAEAGRLDVGVVAKAAARGLGEIEHAPPSRRLCSSLRARSHLAVPGRQPWGGGSPRAGGA